MTLKPTFVGFLDTYRLPFSRIAEFMKALLNGDDYDGHYYNLKSLSEGLNDIKIILNILQGRDFND